MTVFFPFIYKKCHPKSYHSDIKISYDTKYLNIFSVVSTYQPLPWLLDSLYIWAGLSLFAPESGGERATWKLTLRLMHIIKHEGIPVGAFKSRTSISFFLFFWFLFRGLRNSNGIVTIDCLYFFLVTGIEFSRVNKKNIF